MGLSIDWHHTYNRKVLKLTGRHALVSSRTTYVEYPPTYFFMYSHCLNMYQVGHSLWFFDVFPANSIMSIDSPH